MPRTGALFLCLCLLATNTSSADNQSVVVAKVIDGDTVILNDKRHIRLIGINTPEIGIKGRPDQPLAQQAKQRLQALIHAANTTLTAGRQPQDHHGRTLAYLNSGHIDVQQRLLEEGFAWLVAIPPNISRIRRYSESQAQAKKHKRGIWAHSFYQPREASNLGSLDRGFLQVRGKIKNIGRSRKYIYLNFSHRFSVRISHQDWNTYFHDAPEIFNGKTVIVRGWISKQGSHKLGMRIGHPAMIEIDESQ